MRIANSLLFAFLIKKNLCAFSSRIHNVNVMYSPNVEHFKFTNVTTRIRTHFCVYTRVVNYSKSFCEKLKCAYK